MKPRRFESLLGALLVIAVARSAFAEPSSDLAAVEEAYRDVDFESVRQRADTAIRAGGHDLSEMARLEFLLGVSNAALGRAEEAQTAFIRLLGIDPTQKLDRELSPRLRAPYLEARGFWSSNRERISASERVEAGVLRVTLSDPAKMLHQVRVSVRIAGQGEFRDSLHASGPTLRVALARGSSEHDLELALALLDEFGNTVGEHGSKAAPITLRAERSAAGQQLRARQPGSERQPSYLLPGALSALGVASSTAAVYFHVQRERSARKWNSSACEHPGATRAEQCADVERRIDQDQWLSLGLYAGGAALLTLGVLSFLANTRENREQASASVACDVAFSTALGRVQCAGTF